jgi:dynein heavy chain, axonemal
MGTDLELMRDDLVDNKVPKIWKDLSYVSLKPLSSWIVDLNERIDFMRNWATKGHPTSYWLAGFFFPNGFMTATLQTHARKHIRPVDKLKFCFDILQEVDERDLEGEHPEDGVYIHSLFMQNAKWDSDSCCLVDPSANEMYFNMPIIHFLPYETEEEESKEKSGILN